MSYYPSAPFTNPFTPAQWRTLLLIADTFIPALSNTDALLLRETVRARVKDPDWAAIEDYISTPASEDTDFTSFLSYLFARHFPAGVAAKVGGICDVMAAGGVKSYLFTGTSAPFHELDARQREAVVQGWRTAYFTVFRTLFKALQRLVMSAYLRSSKKAHKAMGYAVEPDSEEVPKEEFWEFEFEEFGGVEKAEMEVDVVVVGSGCGGGVVAAKLAEEGLKVVVVEKGRAFRHQDFPYSELEGTDRMYEGGGGLSSADGMGAVLAASTWGGGSTVNWSASLQIDHHVRQEWSNKYGLKFASTPEFQDCMDSVSSRMGVTEAPLTDPSFHSAQTLKFLRGAHLAGYRTSAVPRNTGGHPHFCGSCAYGCPTGGKRGGTITYLVDAQKAGAKCIQRCTVSGILFDGNRATGITATVAGTEPSDTISLTITAKRVIISAGSLHTPLLLARSGITSPHVGAHLRVHPSCSIFSQFDNEILQSWRGPPISAAVFALENLSGDFYGVKLMPGSFHPMTSFIPMPWRSALNWRTNSLFFKSGTSTLTILRERESEGTVTAHPTTGAPVINYTFALPDRERFTRGIMANVECMVAAGADEVFTFGQDALSFRVDKTSQLGLEEPGFKAFMEELKRKGCGPAWTSAHQMGTARMSGRAEEGVCDTKGRVWGREGLYVADASLFPSPSGVNPMVTVMALAEWVARGVVAEVRAESKE